MREQTAFDLERTSVISKGRASNRSIAAIGALSEVQWKRFHATARVNRYERKYRSRQVAIAGDGRDERWFLIGAPLQVRRLCVNETLNFRMKICCLIASAALTSGLLVAGCGKRASQG